MALKLIIDSIEDVPEAVRTLYAEKEGKFHLDVDGIEDNTAIKADLRKANKEAADRRKQLEAWAKLGKTPEEIEELVAAAAQADEDKLKNAGEWDKLRLQMNEKHELALKAKDVVIAAKDGEVGSMRKTLERHLVDAQATAAIAAEKGVPTLLLPHVQKHIKVIRDEASDEYSVKVVDTKGDPRVNAKGDPLTVQEFVAEMKANEIFGRAFEGSGQSGSGMQPGNGKGGGIPQNKRRSDFKTEKERGAFVEQHGLAAYQALPA
jgi:hypothetical protein